MDNNPTSSRINTANLCENTLPTNTNLLDEQQEYPLLSIIGCLMFANGDSNHPLEICRKFLLDLVRSQLQMLRYKASKLAIARRSHCIGFPEIVFAFRRHPGMLRRLIAYIRLVDSMPNLVKKFGLEKEEGNIPEADGILSTILKDMPTSNATKSLINAVNEFDVMGHLLAGVDGNSPTDPVKMERMQKIIKRIQIMDSEQYELFTEARQNSFLNRSDKQPHYYAKNFVKWTETAPIMPIEPGAVWVLNFCANEIMAILVESALICREQEKPMFLGPSVDCDLIDVALNINHYKEALRRNRGFAMRGDILFGCF